MVVVECSFEVSRRKMVCHIAKLRTTVTTLNSRLKRSAYGKSEDLSKTQWPGMIGSIVSVTASSGLNIQYQPFRALPAAASPYYHPSEDSQILVWQCRLHVNDE